MGCSSSDNGTDSVPVNPIAIEGVGVAATTQLLSDERPNSNNNENNRINNTTVAIKTYETETSTNDAKPSQLPVQKPASVHIVALALATTPAVAAAATTSTSTVTAASSSSSATTIIIRETATATTKSTITLGESTPANQHDGRNDTLLPGTTRSKNCLHSFDTVLSPVVARTSLALSSPVVTSTTPSTTTRTIDNTTAPMVPHDHEITNMTDHALLNDGGEEAIHHLRNIFATPISFAINAIDSTGIGDIAGGGQMMKMPNYPKTNHEMKFLENVLQNHYLFETQPKSSLKKLIDAFEMCTITVNDPNAIKVMNDDTIKTIQYNVDIIQQGETVTNDTAYFYVLYYGQCCFQVDDKVVGYAHSGDSFGELALLYNGPRAATVTAVLQEKAIALQQHQQYRESTSSTSGPNDEALTSSKTNDIAPNLLETNALENIDQDMTTSSSTEQDDIDTGEHPFDDYTVVLFRVHQRNFRMILQLDDQDNENVKMKLLNGIEFLRNMSMSVKENFTSVMVPFTFNEGDCIVQKGILDCPWYVIERGTVRVTDLDHGYQDFFITEGTCFGDRAIMSNTPAVGSVIAETAGVGFTVDRETFRSLIGNVENAYMILRTKDSSKLKGIHALKSATQTNDQVLHYLLKQIVDQIYPVGEVLCTLGQPIARPPSLYLIRKGKVLIDKGDSEGTGEPIILELDSFFGDDQLLADMRRGTYISPYTATVIEECTCGILKLRDCRNVIDTRRMGEPDIVLDFDTVPILQSVDGGIGKKELQVHRMIGAGTFGQVFLVSWTALDGTERLYALKVQSKYELCRSGQAKSVVREKNIMTLFHNPFVTKLLSAFQDTQYIYIC